MTATQWNIRWSSVLEDWTLCPFSARQQHLPSLHASGTSTTHHKQASQSWNTLLQPHITSKPSQSWNTLIKLHSAHKEQAQPISKHITIQFFSGCQIVNSNLIDWLSCGFTSHSTQHRSFPRSSSQPISWLSTEKLKQTQQKQTWIRNKIYNIKLTQKTKARFIRLLRHPTWKQRGPTLVLALHKFVTYFLTYLDTYPHTYSPGTHTGPTAI